MSVDQVTTGTEGSPAPGLGGLLASEVLRARSRRAWKWLTPIAALGVLLVGVLLWVNTAQVSQADWDAAAQRFVAEQEPYYQECLANPQIPEEEKAQACWKPSPEEIQDNATYYLDARPFSPGDMMGLLGLAGGLGLVVGLMISASAGGADWGARTMGLLLSWEPRRLRVFLARLAVAVAMCLGIQVLLVGLALGLGLSIASAHDVVGATSSQDLAALSVDPSEALELALRWLPLAVLAAAAGYAVAMATRSTGWAIGASLALIAVVESVIQAIWPWGSQWLIQTNAAAWISGGLDWVIDRNAYNMSSSGTSDELGAFVPAGQIWISQGRALLTLSVMALAALTVSMVLLRRRDVD